MKRKWIRGLAMAAALVTILGAALVCPLSGSAAEDGKEDPVPDLVNSLTVTYPTEIIGAEDDWLKDMKTADIVVDVYKVADAKPNVGYDGYYYDHLAEGYDGLLSAMLEEDNKKPEAERLGFANYLTTDEADSVIINMDAVDSVFWDALAQAAAKKTIEMLDDKSSDSDQEVQKACSKTIHVSKSSNASESEDTVLKDLGNGLYLLIPHDEHLEDVKKYSIEEDGRIVTLAYSKVHAYVFNPILVSLPTKEAYDYGDGKEVINTGNPGEWLYDMTVALKAERLNGSLEIVKRVPNYENSEPATFVFQVTATSPVGDRVFDRVLSLAFTEAGEKTLLIENIPAGSIVTVKEVYSGGYKKEPGAVIRFERVDGRVETDAYGNPVLDANGNPIPLEPGQLISDDVASVTIGAARLVVVEFENNYDFNRRGGHGITNHFSYDSEIGDWVLTQFPDNAEGAKGTKVPGNPEPKVTPAENE